MANEQYAKTLGAQIASMQRQLAQMSAGERAATLGFSSIEDSYIRAYDAQGQAMMLLGKQTDGNYAVTYQDGAPPPKTSGPLVTAHQLSLSIGWDGEFAKIDNTPTPRPTNVVRVDVHVSKTSGFTPDGTTAIGSLAGEGVVSVFADSEPHFVRLVAVTNADVIGPPSEEVGVIPLAASQIAAGAIGADQIAANVILSSRIIVGDPVAGRVELQGGATVDSGLTAFNALGQKIVQIRPTGSPLIVNNADGKMVFSINNNGFIGTVNPATGAYVWLFNTDGSLQVNNTDGTKTFTIDTAGNVTAKGTIRTADSGGRIELKVGVGITFFGNSTATGTSTNIQQYLFTDSGVSKAGFRVVGPNTAGSGAQFFGDMMMGGASTEFWSIRIRRASDLQEFSRIILRSNNLEIVSGPSWGQAHYVKDNWVAKLFMPWGGNAANGGNSLPITLLQNLVYRHSDGNDYEYKAGFQNAVNPQFAAVVYSAGGLVLKDYSFGNFTTFTAGDINGGIITYNQLRQNSAMYYKEEIEPLPGSALEVVRGAPVSRWHYRDQPSDKHIGPMADDLPEWVTIDALDTVMHDVIEPDSGLESLVQRKIEEFDRPNAAIDLASQVGVLWEALRELDAELDEYRNGDKPSRRTAHKRRLAPGGKRVRREPGSAAARNADGTRPGIVHRSPGIPGVPAISGEHPAAGSDLAAYARESTGTEPGDVIDTAALWESQRDAIIRRQQAERRARRPEGTR